MSFSLYRCGDDTYVVVPSAMTPPLAAIRQYGSPTFVRAIPRQLLASPVWGRVSEKIDAEFYAVISADEMDQAFDTA